MIGFFNVITGFNLTHIQDLKSTADILYVPEIPIGDNIRYVSATGSNTDDGLTPDTSWRTIQNSVDWASAGDIVYIKAGNYGAENITSVRSGTAISPIQFIGYQNTPLDAPTLDYTYSDASLELGLDSTVMPLLDGGNRSTGGWGIFIRGEDYVQFKNFQVRNYQYGGGIWASTGSVMDNFYMESFGDINSYSGLGITCQAEGGIECSSVTVSNTVVLNAGAQAFTISTNDVIFDNCKAYGNDNQTGVDSGTDYYFIVSGNSNTITNSYCHRANGMTHGGHGFHLKGSCTDNLIEDCTANNMNGAFSFRWSDVTGNTFRRITATEELGTHSYGLVIRDGAHNNTVEDYNSDNLRHAFRFQETTEGTDSQYSGYQNSITGGEHTNVNNSFVIYYSSLSSGAGISTENTWTNVTFNGTGETQGLHYILLAPQDNEFINCTFNDIETKSAGGGGSDATTVYTNPTITNCGFTTLP